jgi:hypothetical protein
VTTVLLHPRPNIESRQGVGRAGKLYHGALLTRTIDAVTYLTNLSEGPSGSEYELEVLNYLLSGGDSTVLEGQPQVDRWLGTASTLGATPATPLWVEGCDWER